MAQQVKALATKTDDLRSIPTTTWWKERANPQKLTSERRMYTMHAPTHMHTLACKVNTQTRHLEQDFRQGQGEINEDLRRLIQP